MRKHLNFLGFSLWIPDEINLNSREVALNKPLYSPSILAAYCILCNLAVGIFLYSLNISRRGDRTRGRLFAALSGVLILLYLLIPTSSRFARSLLNVLAGISLYQCEKPYFDKARRNGAKQARWWPPFLWIVALISISLFLQLLLF